MSNNWILLPLFVGLTPIQAAPASSQGESTGKIEILLPGSHLGDREWPTSGMSWFGLYAGPTGYYLKRTTVQLDSVPNPCSGLAVQVSVDTEAEPLLLVRGPLPLQEGPIATVFAGSLFLPPREHVVFELNPSLRYSFSARGQMIRQQGLLRDYALSIHRLTHPNVQSQELATFQRANLDSPPELRWLGDLDRDGKLDAFLYLPGRYTLYVSSLAGNELLANVAGFAHVIC